MFKVNVRRGKYGFSTRLKGTTKENKEVTMYVDVQFAKCEAPTNNILQINVKDGFLSCYESMYGEKVKLVVMDYEILKIYDNDTTTANTEETYDTAGDLLDDLDIQFDLE